MEGKRTVISQTRTRRTLSEGKFFMEQVVYRGDFGSRTKHEKVKDQNARRMELSRRPE